MNFRTTLILLFLLVVAGVAYFWVNRDTGPKEADKPDKSELTEGRKLFDGVNASDVTKVTLAEKDGPKLVFEKAGSKWKLTQPISVPADTGTVNAFVDDLLSQRSTGKVDSSGADTGLAQPNQQIELVTPSRTIKVDVGSRSALGDALYVRVDGASQGEMIASRFRERLGKSIDEWRDKRVAGVTSDEIKQVEVTRDGSRIAVAKTGPDWSVTSPQMMPGEEDEISGMTRAIGNLTADQFVKADSPSMRLTLLDSPRMTVRYSTAPPSTQPTTQPMAGGTVLSLGGYTDVLKEKIYAKLSDSPQVFTVPATTLKDFEKAPLDLRDRRVLNLKPEEVSEVTVSMERPSTTQPTTKPSEQKTIKITQRKENLQLGPAFGVPVGPALPSASPATQPSTPAADLSPAPSTLPTTMPATQPSAGFPCSDNHVAEGQTIVYSDVPVFFAAETQPSAAPSTQPAEAGTQAATTQPVAATQPVATTQAALTTQPAVVAATQPAEPEKPKSKWVLDADTAADDTQVTDLLDSLHPFKAMKYLDKAPPATQPTMTTYVVTIKTVAAGGKAETHELRITDAGGTSQPIGTMNGLTFEVDRSFVRKLEGDFKTPRADNFPSTPPMGFPGMQGMPGLPPGHP